MTAIPPGNCGIHGYHGRTVCPRCSTSASPSTPLLSQPEHLTLPDLRAENEQLRRERRQAIDALRQAHDDLAALWESHPLRETHPIRAKIGRVLSRLT